MGVPRRTKTVSEATRSRDGMHVCPSCSSGFVQPVNWFEQGAGQWHVELRCPECEWWGRGTYEQTEVDRYDEELDRAGQELIEDLRSLTRANMEEEASRFSEALATDSILPEDFWRARIPVPPCIAPAAPRGAAGSLGGARWELFATNEPCG